jgi:hypothetical protein
MLKRILFISLLVGVFLAGGLLYAQETSKTSYSWTKVGDGFYEVWDVNGILFVENPEAYNNVILRKSKENFKTWDEAKRNHARLGLKSSTVKQFNPTGELAVVENWLFYTKIKYGNNQELSVKVVRDRDKVRIAREENSSSPTIYRSQNSNYHIFEDNEGIWGIQPLLTSPMSFEVTKLTKDQINGKNREEIQAEFSEDKALSWTGNPQISPDGNYVAYVSNKGGQGYQLWLIDIKQKSDQNLNTPFKILQLYGWADNNTIVYSFGDSARNKDFYLYNIKTNLSKQLLKDICLINFNQNVFIYTKKGEDQQIYFYRRTDNKEIMAPRLPDIALFDPSFSKDSLSMDGSKLLIITTKDSNSSKIEKLIYLLRSDTNSLTEIKYTEKQNPDSLSKWIGTNQVIIYTHEYDYISRSSTWILTFKE